MAIYLDDPKETLPERCREEVAITFRGEDWSAARNDCGHGLA
jgi:DNA gyrase inhibitor GyrI